MIRLFKKNPELERNYHKAMQEYIDLGFLTPAETAEPNSYYHYLPHHVVVKESCQTTKYRVVFNASAPTSNGISLNDIVAVTPTILPNLFTLLLHLCLHKIAILDDIEKMYPQITVADQDLIYQRVLWIINGEITEWVMKRFTLGVASAPYLAIRVLFHLAKEEGHKFILAAEVLMFKMYVDNMLAGASNIFEAQR